MPRLELNPNNYARHDERTASRKCLHCGRFFRSYHAGNRICPRCEKLDDFNHRRSGLDEQGFVK